MIPTQNFENYPEFANAGQKSQPNDAKYAAGFIPSDVLPAEWLNWFLNGATKGVTALNTGVKSVEQEINTVLESRSVNPDINAAGQLLSVLNKIKAEAVLAAHPVGSLYWTSKNENPAITFGGGTWKQITDIFVLAAGSKYKVGNTGGAETVTLTTENMPSHSHTFTPSGTITMNAHSHGLNNHTHSFRGSGTTNGMSRNATGKWGTRVSNSMDNGDGVDRYIPSTSGNVSVDMNSYIKTLHQRPDDSFHASREHYYSIDVSHTHTYSVSGTTDGNSSNTTSVTSTGSFSGSAGTTDESGSGTAFSVLPPYVVKYCWERTA
nr:MAG TPA: baseplate protein [Caudoviricetes sp.]